MSLPSLENADWLNDPALQSVFAALNGEGVETRAVGGAVRNALMGLPVAEVDLATTATPEETMRLAEAAGLKAVPTGIDHGTVTVVSGGKGFEVTTLRRDVETDGRHATVAFTTDWAEDAKRRDFTLNALYADRQGTVFDPLDGYADLEAGRIRFIGDAETRIKEDYLRILRFFRFTATFGEGEIDPVGLAACVRLRAGLAGLSAERIWAELKRLLVAPKACETVEILYDYGLLPGILGAAPELPQFKRLVGLEHFFELTPDAPLRLAVLGVLVTEDAERLSARFRLSRAEQAVLLLVAEAGESHRFEETHAKALLYRLGEADYRRVLLIGWARAGEAADRAQLSALLALPARWEVPEFPLKGEDIVALGVAAGPEVGRILGAVEAAWIEDDFADEREALLRQAEALAKGA
ncbi:CCA tRNA nucleotidyltransferase [Methyloligella sp. 2.7D]|uniref:CCA tRNA nucleotidyltransferase n=1 Tax=unclassified Methyloligella TaxID=2625955 RepID=UPI00157BD758|nr:CCA tRNA nucleotidyltransferase [Methyloligella sp. GL2]QKP77007.1 CCA tRNA nucleotidyltransferase [Methyloligella sp. GL2]